jgi:hypothetical protein
VFSCGLRANSCGPHIVHDCGVPVSGTYACNQRFHGKCRINIIICPFANTHLSNLMAEEPEGSTMLITIPPLVTILSQFYPAPTLTTRSHGAHSSFSRGGIVSLLRNVAPFMQPEGSQEPNTRLCPSIYS